MAAQPGAKYAWRGLSFKAPKGLADQTVVTFIEDVTGPTNCNVTISFIDFDQDLEALRPYIETQLDELSRTVREYRLVKSEDGELSGRPTVTVEHAATIDGRRLQQMQTYWLRAPREVVVFTASSVEGSKQTPPDLLAQLLSSMTVADE